MGIGAPDAIAFGRFLMSGDVSGIYLSILVGSGRGGHYDTLPGGSLVVGRKSDIYLIFFFFFDTIRL